MVGPLSTFGFLLFLVLGVKPKTSCMLGKHPTMEPHSQPLSTFFFFLEREREQGKNKKVVFLLSTSFLAKSKHLINFKDISLQTLLMQPK
jgi:hypothetical protein